MTKGEIEMSNCDSRQRMSFRALCPESIHPRTPEEFGFMGYQVGNLHRAAIS